MNPLYDASIRMYGAVARVMGCGNEKARAFSKGRRDALSELERLTLERAPEGYDFWFHAASLGEFEQARPLIEALKKSKPEIKILLSFFSPSGYNVRKNYDKATAVVYMPADTKKNARRFIEIARPKKAIFVKYEFWLNFLNALSDASVPTYLISAIFRPNQIFFKPWGSSFRKALRNFSTLYVQDDRSVELLEGIGVERVKKTGDTRFDRVYEIMQECPPFPMIEGWRPNDFTMVVGSSWQQDEGKYIPWINEHPEVRVIIAPHEFDEKRICDLQNRLNRPSVKWTDIDDESNEPISTNVQTLIVNTFGKLASLYRYADVTLVGGGFGAGIHNINEAAVYGMPILFGPKNGKFKEAGDLIECGGAFEYRTDEELSDYLDKILQDSEFRKSASVKASTYIMNNLGATATILSDIS